MMTLDEDKVEGDFHPFDKIFACRQSKRGRQRQSFMNTIFPLCFLWFFKFFHPLSAIIDSLTSTLHIQHSAVNFYALYIHKNKLRYRLLKFLLTASKESKALKNFFYFLRRLIVWLQGGRQKSNNGMKIYFYRRK